MLNLSPGWNRVQPRNTRRTGFARCGPMRGARLAGPSFGDDFRPRAQRGGAARQTRGTALAAVRVTSVRSFAPAIAWCVARLGDTQRADGRSSLLAPVPAAPPPGAPCRAADGLTSRRLEVILELIQPESEPEHMNGFRLECGPGWRPPLEEGSARFALGQGVDDSADVRVTPGYPASAALARRTEHGQSDRGRASDG